MRRIILFGLIAILSPGKLFPQTVYEHISNVAIYDFLDEMANQKFIELNDVIKPYSRIMIYQKLEEVNSAYQAQKVHLNKRQLKELGFYLRSYQLEGQTPKLLLNKKKAFVNKKETLALALNPPGILYKDSVFRMLIRPVLGASYSSNTNGGLKHTWGGASMEGYIGKNLGFYTSVRDNDENRMMIKPTYFTQRRGAPVKDFGNQGVQYAEARGGLMYSWKWGAVGLVKDHVEWGVGYHGTNIQSGRAPSFAQIKLELKPVRWFEFNYYHGWLVSNVLDSARSYWTNNTYRAVYHTKYIAANMFTFYPVKYFNISIGNSIVYIDVGGGGPHAVFLIPFLFYKAVDLTVAMDSPDGYASNNNQFFFCLSSRNIKHLHLYFSLFADDISVHYFFDKNLYNSFSYKAGFRLSDFLLQNTFLTIEYTRTNPYVYQHHAETQTYTSNDFNMGNYLLDNSQEIYFGLKYIPLCGLVFNTSFTFAQHGDEYDINDPNAHVHSDPILKNITWERKSFLFSVRYEIVSNTYVFANYNYQNITGDKAVIQKRTPEYYYGKTNTFTFGANIGF